MKISRFLFRSNIPKARKEYITSCVNTFEKRFSNPKEGLYPRTRNKIGIMGHSAVVLSGMNAIYKSIAEGDIWSTLDYLLWTKINLDFAIYVNNINKKKASVFSQFMKNRGINDENELVYGMRKFLLRIGSFHYLILHPDKTRRLALSGKYKKTFETGLLTARTDNKNIISYLMSKFISR